MKRLIAVLCALSIVTLPSATAQAGYNEGQKGFVLLLIVNTTDDHNDNSCDVNDCTLREAMFAANDASTADIINFSVTGVINLVEPLPVISDGVTIQGPGANLLTVRRDPAWGPFSIFDVATAETVNLSSLTITHGASTGNFSPAGGINSTSGTLFVTNCIISDNSGSGIGNQGGSLTVTNSTRASKVGIRPAKCLPSRQRRLV